MGRSGRVVVIVGASRGIGRAVTQVWARRGVRLVLLARDPQALAVTARQARDRGAEVLEIAGDITVPGVLADAVERTMAEFGRIDVWAGVAGVVAYGSVEQTPLGRVS